MMNQDYIKFQNQYTAISHDQNLSLEDIFSAPQQDDQPAMFENQQIQIQGDQQQTILMGECHFESNANGQYMSTKVFAQNMVPTQEYVYPMMAENDQNEVNCADLQLNRDFINDADTITHSNNEEFYGESDQSDDIAVKAQRKLPLRPRRFPKTIEKSSNKQELKSGFMDIAKNVEYDWKLLAKKMFTFASEQLGAAKAKEILLNPQDAEVEQEFSKNKRFSDDEDKKLLALVSKYDYNWKQISKEMSNRKPLVVKNRFYYLKKKLGSSFEETFERQSFSEDTGDDTSSEGSNDSNSLVRSLVNKCSKKITKE